MVTGRVTRFSVVVHKSAYHCDVCLCGAPVWLELRRQTTTTGGTEEMLNYVTKQRIIIIIIIIIIKILALWWDCWRHCMSVHLTFRPGCLQSFIVSCSLVCIITFSIYASKGLKDVLLLYKRSMFIGKMIAQIINCLPRLHRNLQPSSSAQTWFQPGE
jgi:glucan phosphoethanolaminetransferase (alkaline phosphatase superfamily)